MELPAALMPCLSSNAVSALNESISVSNAESQLALPLMITTFFGSSVICSPNGAGVGAGAGVAGTPGAGVADGLAAGVGDCAGAAPPQATAAIGISTIMARRKELLKFISDGPHRPC